MLDVEASSECDARLVLSSQASKPDKPSTFYDRFVLKLQRSIGRLCRCVGGGRRKGVDEQPWQQHCCEHGSPHKPPAAIEDVPVRQIEAARPIPSPDVKLLQEVVTQAAMSDAAFVLPVNPFAAIAHPLAALPTPHLLEMLPLMPRGPLLPHAEHQRVCVVLDLDETLVHSSFTPPHDTAADLVVPLTLPDKSTHDIYVCKRPGVDVFLERVLARFEVVIFTASLPSYADPVINFLDLNGRIKHRLYRDACVFLQGLYIKDLSRLGRPIASVLLVDNSPASFLLHPEHAMAIKSWFSDPADTELHRLAVMLDGLHAANDVCRWRQSIGAQSGCPVY